MTVSVLEEQPVANRLAARHNFKTGPHRGDVPFDGFLPHFEKLRFCGLLNVDFAGVPPWWYWRGRASRASRRPENTNHDSEFVSWCGLPRLGTRHPGL
jgi:hypothetical protein